jgi:undecaprenyl-diphosphatase
MPSARAGKPAVAAGTAGTAGTAPPVLAPGNDARERSAFRLVWRRSPWLVPGGLLLILALVTVNVLADGPLAGADRQIRAVVRAHAASGTLRWLRDGWHAPAQLLVNCGNYQVAVPVLGACALIVAVRHRTARPLLAALAAVVLLLATVTPAKILIGRTGPGLNTVGSGGLGVFPSGHAATAAVCLGVAVMLLLPALPAGVRRAAVAGVAGLCFLNGVALVWCDYHWFTDVLGGWALAGLIAIAVMKISQASPPPSLMAPWGRGRG